MPCTEDRIREGLGRPPSFSMSSKITKGRKSIFKELGLVTNQPKEPSSNEKKFSEPKGLASPTGTHAPDSLHDNANDDGEVEAARRPRQQGKEERVDLQSEPTSPSTAQRPWYSRLSRAHRPRINTASSAPPSMATITRLSVMRIDNDFLALDPTKSWDTSSPALRSLSRPTGPPAVSPGYLWNDYNNLYLYGGQFADNRLVEPAPISTRKYFISGQTWTEYSSPRTSADKNADPGDQPVQRAAEGAGISVQGLGLNWYFDGRSRAFSALCWVRGEH
ncbi:hypothetical protein B0I37DRAFT_351400 [Chaetomium sp. MPI-CAGE-AT-0009]|nr:hypothetical protein B0I37DRAFT_351400 [Chaetomium sp. MPI-CAGE-AT-0009]